MQAWLLRRAADFAQGSRYTLFLLGALMACGRSTVEITPANDIYRQAVLEHADGNYDLAIMQYRYLLDHYPLDSRAEEIELRIAHAHLANEAYPEAVAAFSDFQRMHPTSPHLAEVEYRIAEAYVAQMDTIDRDLSNARNAHERLQSVVRRHPNSEFAALARKQLSDVREHLAEREFYVAKFYFDRDDYPAGKIRAAVVLVEFPDTRVAQRTAEQLAGAAETAGDAEIARLARDASSELEARDAVRGEEEDGEEDSPDETASETQAVQPVDPSGAVAALRTQLAPIAHLATAPTTRPPSL
jgi:outer membrane protein assembly factor BamD